jgi:hypothetical protein
MTIIGYFHICQKPGWQRSFDLIFPKIRESGLYDATAEIICGVVNDNGTLIDDVRLHDPKLKVIYFGPSANYERPTLLHMRKNATTGNKYWYLHTKGLRHFGTRSEHNVIDWINLMVYWNVEQWRRASDVLDTHDTYGCNMIHNLHYSGNFWWASGAHILQLPTHIESYYTAPEDYIFKTRASRRFYNVYSSGLQGGGHYNKGFPRNIYCRAPALASAPVPAPIRTIKFNMMILNRNKHR